MRRSFTILISFMLLLSISLTSIAAGMIDTTIAPMLQKVLPAVVNIRAQIKITDFNTLRELQKRRHPQNEPDQKDGDMPTTFVSVGSGVIVDSGSGFILTNAHVVSDAQSIAITLSDGRHFKAKVIGADKPSDVALLQIKAKNLTAVTISDSNKLKVGDFVAAIGNPFGLSQTVTSGIVSALGRTTLGIENYENFIQTDAPINPGNSGGALINMQGELVGINTAILAPSQGNVGIGFAIPANMAKSVMQQLVQFGNIRRSILGIGIQDLTPELTDAFHISQTKGAVVTQVLPSSPAEQAHLQVGDIIIAVNGSNIKNANEVVTTIGFLRVDTKVNVKILRDNKPLTLEITLSDPKNRKDLIQKIDPFLYGVSLKDFSIVTPVFGQVEGVLVVTVEEDSSAWNSDLRPGDIIISVDKKKIKNIDALKTSLSKEKQTALLNVLRGPTAIFLVLNKEP